MVSVSSLWRLSVASADLQSGELTKSIPKSIQSSLVTFCYPCAHSFATALGDTGWCKLLAAPSGGTKAGCLEPNEVVLFAM